MKDDLGIAMIVNPEQEMANEIFNIINLPSVAQIEQFAKGRVSLVEVVPAQTIQKDVGRKRCQAEYEPKG